MTFQEIINSYPMRYWSLPSNSSDAQKKKLKNSIDGGEYFLTQKRDGAMYRYSFDGETSLLQSRTESKKTGTFVEKTDNVPTIINLLESFVPAKTILLGEICFKDRSKTSKDVISIMGCLPSKAIARQKESPVAYYIFDVLIWGGEDMTDWAAEDRVGFIRNIISTKIDNESIEFVEPIFENISEVLAQWLNAGEEGGVLMLKKGKYDARLDKAGKPSWRSIKVKQNLKETIDLVIMDILPATKEYKGKYLTTHRFWENIVTGELFEGNYSGKGGQYIAVSEDYFRGLPNSLQLGAWYDGTLIEVCRVSGLNDIFKWELKNKQSEYINNVVIEVTAMSIDPIEKTLRHPKIVQVRSDKNSEECLYSDIFN